MIERIGLSYLTYGLEMTLFLLVLLRGRWEKLKGVATYLGLLLILDAAGRPFFLYRYGYHSSQYNNFYWISDDILTLSAFLLMAWLFYRVTRNQGEMWAQARLLLVMVFVILLVVSFLSVSHNLATSFRHSIVVFEQNLYFTCLVLNTLLYIYMQQIDCEDDQLGLLVCGMGIQFAGPTASWALLRLFPHNPFVTALVQWVGPLCTLGMLAIWTYAVARPAKPREPAPPRGRSSPPGKMFSDMAAVLSSGPGSNSAVYEGES